ncbi:MAG: tyrosine-type recombinase/integrase [Proteobacteria bacterium]|nr:tyrosine-type recombinase/integrase [Pseudomonadota bacterium]
MAKLNSGTISGRTVDALPVGDRETVFWDRDMAGFGVRVYPSGAKVYLVQVRVGGKTKRVTIGRHGLVSAEDARLAAAELISRIKRGKESTGSGTVTPTVNGTTLAEVADRYMREHVAVRCKPTTARAYRVALENYLLPEFGSRSLDAIGQDQVAALHYRLHKTPAMANQVVEVLSRLFYAAESWGVAPESGNPCQFVKKYKKRSCERFLSEEEFRRLGDVLSEMQAEGTLSASAAAAFRLLMLTGCRRNEILTLQWSDVDLDASELRLRDAKTGARWVALSPTAHQVLATIPRRPGNPWVIAGRRASGRLSNLNMPWISVRKRAGLEDVRIHDLRHSFASRALALGESLPMIGKLLGHRQVQTTARYAHLAQESVKASSARVAESIAVDMETPPAVFVTP